MFKKALATVALAVVAVFGVPMAANASSDVYVPPSNIIVSDSTPVAGQPVTVTFTAGSFQGGEPVNFTIANAPAGTTLAVVKAATAPVSLTKPANADGSVSFVVTFPAAASGTYNVTAVGQLSGNVGTAALTVVPADAGAGSGLPVTGAEISAGVIWIAGGALVLGALLLVVVGIRRRAAAQN